MPHNYRPTAMTYPTYPAFTDDDDWLEVHNRQTAPEPTPCCAKCRRGTPAHGERPCGYAAARTGCPNENCAHHRGR